MEGVEPSSSRAGTRQDRMIAMRRENTREKKGTDRSTDKTKVPIDTKQTLTRVAVQMVRMQPPLEYDQYLGMLRGRKACSQSQSVSHSAQSGRPSVDQSVSQTACARSQSAGLVGVGCDETDFTCHPFVSLQYVHTRTVQYEYGVDMVGNGYAMACMSTWMPSQKPTQRVRQGPRQPRRGRRRLIQPVQLADAGDHLWSCVLHRTSYRRTLHSKRSLPGTVFFF